MDRAHWKSPSFRGRPRFRGGGDGSHFGTPRSYSPHWQQRSPSPFRFQSGGSPYQQQMRSPYDSHSFATSTPNYGPGGNGGGRRPFFRGGGRFNKRQSFDRNSQSSDIENWISSEMWSDPWRHLIQPLNSSSSVNQPEESGARTKFAESDFDIATDTSELAGPSQTQLQSSLNEES